MVVGASDGMLVVMRRLYSDEFCVPPPVGFWMNGVTVVGVTVGVMVTGSAAATQVTGVSIVLVGPVVVLSQFMRV